MADTKYCSSCKNTKPAGDFFDSWGDDQPAKPSRVAAAAEDDEDDDPWGTKEPVPVAKKPSVEDRRAQRRAELEAKRKARAAARRLEGVAPAAFAKTAPAPKPAADDGWGDDAWGDDVPAKPVALK